MRDTRPINDRQSGLDCLEVCIVRPGIKSPTKWTAVLANGYVYAVPRVSTLDGIFRKTAFSSRRLKAYGVPDESNEEDA
jgi:hypothetical protein